MKSVETKTSQENKKSTSGRLNSHKKDSFFSFGKQNKESFLGSDFIQPKLKIGRPNDRYEQEADQVAKRVLLMPDHKGQGPLKYADNQSPESSSLIRLKCESCVGEDELQKKGSGNTGNKDKTGPEMEKQLQTSRGRGRKLPDGVQTELSKKIGSDFSEVKIHTDTDAIRLNEIFGARAFTHGSDIYFNKGQYNPESISGKYLLTHELTHVLQQRGARDKIQRFVNCRDQEGCRKREPGELSRSRNSEMVVSSISTPVKGLLVSHFSIGKSELKDDLQNNSVWANYWGQMVTNDNIRWQILGFSDCHGNDSINTLIRWKRAIAVNNALPTLARQRVTNFKAAPLSQCISRNDTEEARAYNRSALIQQIITEYEFSDGEQIKACPTRKEWLQRAVSKAGISMSDWQPGKGFKKNKETVKKVYAYYQYLYNTDSDLLWAGMAKLAGGTVFDALEKTQLAVRYSEYSSSLQIVHFYATRLMELLLTMQKEIFEDLGWQHQAYIERGLACLESIRAGGDIPIKAWRNIASGEPGRVSAGNRTLLRREQGEILPPYYKKIREMPDMNLLPQAMSLLSKSPIPGGRSFEDVVKDGDITKFKDRWKWITKDMLPKYEGLSDEYRSKLINTPLEQLADRDFPSR